MIIGSYRSLLDGQNVLHSQRDFIKKEHGMGHADGSHLRLQLRISVDTHRHCYKRRNVVGECDVLALRPRDSHTVGSPA